MLGLLGQRVGAADALVVVDLLDGDLGALAGDVVEAGLHRALGHQHDRLLTQLVGRPCHAASVVAVGRGEEGGLTELVLEGLAGQVIIGHFGNVPSELLCDIARHRERAAQHLEGVQPETVALILDVEAAQSEVLRHAAQLCQRSDRVLREALVERARLGDVLERHDRQLRVVRSRHLIDRPFDLIHLISQPSIIRYCSCFVIPSYHVQKESQWGCLKNF